MDWESAGERYGWGGRLAIDPARIRRLYWFRRQRYSTLNCFLSRLFLHFFRNSALVCLMRKLERLPNIQDGSEAVKHIPLMPMLVVCHLVSGDSPLTASIKLQHLIEFNEAWDPS